MARGQECADGRYSRDGAVRAVSAVPARPPARLVHVWVHSDNSGERPALCFRVGRFGVALAPPWGYREEGSRFVDVLPSLLLIANDKEPADG